MVSKGMSTARSQRYKANQILQEKKLSSPWPTYSGNYILPSPTIKPITQAEGAQLALEQFILNQSLLHAASLSTHPYDLLCAMASYRDLYDCS
jgi:hypothetical protein